MKIPLYLLLIFAFARCGTPSNPTLDAFKKVNNSIDSANQLLNAQNTYAYYYSDILLKAEKNTKLAGKAIDLHNQVDITTTIIEQTQASLRKLDSAGKATSAATQLLINTKLGDTLRANIEEAAHQCESGLVDKAKLAAIQGALAKTREITSADQWSNKVFDGQPTVATLTILAYCKMELTKAATMTFKDIDEHLK